MVKIRENHPLEASGDVDIDVWLTGLETAHGFSSAQIAQLRAACLASRNAEQTRSESDKRWQETSCFRTGLEMADILGELNLDAETLVAAILYRAVREERIPLTDIAQTFGAEVATLIEGVLRMASVSAIQSLGDENVLGRNANVQVENLRKMLVAIIDDVRVALVKIAERTCAIRAVKNASEEKRRRVAREVMKIYAPLAHRLGIGHLKWELEDLAFRYLEPDAYRHIARLLDERRVDRQRFIAAAKTQLETALQQAGIAPDITGRAKHIYSIWRKMRNRGIGFSQVYDIRALRVLVSTVQDCYTALGIVHSMFQPIPGEFDDYIAKPKANNYRSLHTSVTGPQGKPLEVQIRTQEMHQSSEFGVAAHWNYKEGGNAARDTGFASKIASLRQVLSWGKDVSSPGEFLAGFKSSLFDETIFVLTPQGKIIDLPRDATPIDF
ncbi:MAG TPA: HD domain-containing protein, partial [Pseudomonadales bacterium]|nr:HD domain-containing protein [Pseudomonadales bacterium]